MQLEPLKRSADYDAVEAELKALFLSLYGQFIDPQVTELALYGMPHLGSDSFISRELSNDGLAMKRNTGPENIRYLFRAWRYRNPQRGTHFLRTYLRVLFGEVYEVEQMYQRKSQPYPTDLLSRSEIEWRGFEQTDFFLTSRLRVDLETDDVPERVIRSLRSAIAARLVLKVRIAKRGRTEMGFAGVMAASSQFVANGNSIRPNLYSGATIGIAGNISVVSVFSAYGNSIRPDTELSDTLGVAGNIDAVAVFTVNGNSIIPYLDANATLGIAGTVGAITAFTGHSDSLITNIEASETIGVAGNINTVSVLVSNGES